MKRVLLIAFLLCVAVQVAPAQQQSLIDIENQWITAIQNRDTAFLNKLLSDDFIDVTWKGTLRDKAQMLHFKKTTILSQRLSALKERVYGDAGVVTGLNTVKIRGLDQAVQVRFTDVFIRDRGVWHAVSAQESVVRKK